jgi:hypothetical protein
MASKRRGGGFRPPELRGTLGTLLRTTTGVVRDALERGAREGRARLDDARATRRRQDALADLGELVLDLIRRGEIDLAELPEARDLVRQLDDFDADATGAEPEPPRPVSRHRFDDRARPTTADRARPTAADRARPTAADRSRIADRAHPTAADRSRIADRARPDDRAHPDDRARRPVIDDETFDERPHRPATDGDGTVSSGAAAAAAAAAARATRPTDPARPRPPSAAIGRAPTKPIKGLWRADVDAPGPDDRPAPPRRSLAPDPHRKGGISFDDDDLNEYMHPDDVPPKGPAKDPGDGDP